MTIFENPTVTGRQRQSPGRRPKQAHGKYLLSGGLLICPTCGGHFEALTDRPGKQRGVYVCSTRRRKPGVCTNRLALPIAQTDDNVLDVVGGEVLSDRFIEELLSTVDKGEADDSARLTADRDRLQREIDNLMDLAASGVSASTLAGKIKDREVQIGKLDRQLKQPRHAPPNIEKLRGALQQRAEEWRPQCQPVGTRSRVGSSGLMTFARQPEHLPGAILSLTVAAWKCRSRRKPPRS